MAACLLLRLPRRCSRIHHRAHPGDNGIDQRQPVHQTVRRFFYPGTALHCAADGTAFADISLSPPFFGMANHVDPVSTAAYSALLPISLPPSRQSGAGGRCCVAAAKCCRAQRYFCRRAALLAADSTDADSSKTEAYDTDHGTLQLDIDAYFTPAQTGATFALPPLLLAQPAQYRGVARACRRSCRGFWHSTGIAAALRRILNTTTGGMIRRPIMPMPRRFAGAGGHAGAGSRVGHQCGAEFASGGDGRQSGVSAGICCCQQPGGGTGGAGKICVVCRATIPLRTIERCNLPPMGR